MLCRGTVQPWRWGQRGPRAGARPRGAAVSVQQHRERVGGRCSRQAKKIFCRKYTYGDDSISSVKMRLYSEIVSDMIQLIKACLVLTVSLEEIILHKKNKKSL